MLISTFLNSERQLRSGWWILLFFLGLASLLVPTLLIAQQHEMDVSISWQAAIVLLVSILCQLLRQKPLAELLGSFDVRWLKELFLGIRLGSALMLIPAFILGIFGWLEYPATLISDADSAGSQIVFVAPPSDSTSIDPIITSGRWLIPSDENAIVIGNHLLQRFPYLKIGDTLTIEANGKRSPWKIVGIYSLTGNISPPLLYVNYKYLSRLINQPGQIFSLRVITSSHDTEFQKTVNEQLQTLYKARGIQVSSTQLSAEFIEEQKAQTDILVYFMLIMASLIAIVGGLGLMGTMSINVLERTREIGVMRAIGASNRDIQGIVIVEGLVIGLISWVVAILIAIPITSVLTRGVGLAILTAPMPAVYGISGIMAWLIFTLLLATFASVFPARQASRLTVKDTLAYE
jgi:putative ABC transport system permease protein